LAIVSLAIFSLEVAGPKGKESLIPNKCLAVCGMLTTSLQLGLHQPISPISHGSAVVPEVSRKVGQISYSFHHKSHYS